MTLLRNHPHSSDFIADLLDLVTRQMLVVESRNPPRQRSSSQEVCEALVGLLEKLEADENYASPRCANCMRPPQGCIGRPEDNQCPTHGDVLKMARPVSHASPAVLRMAWLTVVVSQAPSKRDRDGKRKRQETYAPGDKEESAAFAQPQRMFACPFYKTGMPIGRACMGPDWESAHRMKEHLLRPHTPKSFRDPSGCPRCLEGFKTKELLAQHLRQEPQCLIKAPEIIAGQLTLEQAANLRSTRKKSDMSEEDRWFEIYQILFPDHDLSTMSLTPYLHLSLTRYEAARSKEYVDCYALGREKMLIDGYSISNSGPMLIRNATKEDIPAAGAVAAAAYIDDEQDAFMFPGRKKHPQRYLKTKESIVRHGMNDPTATVIVAVVEEGDQGWSGKPDIVGFCIWFRENGDEETNKDERVEKKALLSRIKTFISGSEVFQYASDLIDPLVSAQNASIMARTCRLPSSNHYFCPRIDNLPQYGIMDIAVHPDFQGRGAARRLVEWGINKAKEEAVPIELSATPEGSGLYTKLGFKKVGVWRWRPGMEGSDGKGGWDIMRWQPEQ
ncbi:hypothetical protein MRS44_005228 [Fusarium solani]|uniref:uncharacterized protein n=1 Tax=Fusarium solani TaxID=169388 RepID=UPI0032C45B39|nr:hypothetical protein MRS44_005228 [Fusarium solani]